MQCECDKTIVSSILVAQLYPLLLYFIALSAIAYKIYSLHRGLSCFAVAGWQTDLPMLHQKRKAERTLLALGLLGKGNCILPVSWLYPTWFETS